MHRLSNQTEVCPQPWILSNVKMLQVFEVVLQVVGQKSCTSLANVASWNDKIDETEKVLAEAQGKTDAMNETYNAAVESAGGDETKAMLALEPDSQAGIETWVPNLSSVQAAVENTNG